MIPLTIGVAIPDEHTRLTRLETNALSCHDAAVGTADVNLAHPQQHKEKPTPAVVPAKNPE
jgi:hypothetical protein